MGIFNRGDGNIEMPMNVMQQRGQQPQQSKKKAKQELLKCLDQITFDSKIAKEDEYGMTECVICIEEFN